IRAYQELGTEMLPVATSGPVGLGALAAAPGGKPRVLAWNSGQVSVRTRVTLPPEWGAGRYVATLFDADHNAPQRTGDDRVVPLGTRDGRDLVFDLAPGSVLSIVAP
ncbi:MAG TPA: hypothetical protein VM536_11010, partial [Chloroflexia bacterium]|nr:hypothetical protein [Chloroflexia bacterium]